MFDSFNSFTVTIPELMRIVWADYIIGMDIEVPDTRSILKLYEHPNVHAQNITHMMLTATIETDLDWEDFLPTFYRELTLCSASIKVEGKNAGGFISDYSQPQHEWLSNFWTDVYNPVWLQTVEPLGIRPDFVSFKNVEYAYQAAKTDDSNERAVVRQARNSGHAKKLGRTVTCRSSWDNLKLNVMAYLLKQKFSPDCEPDVAGETPASLLMGTGYAVLVEGNYWHDTFFGICNRRGRNVLGLLQMAIRAHLFEDGYFDDRTRFL